MHRLAIFLAIALSFRDLPATVAKPHEGGDSDKKGGGMLSELLSDFLGERGAMLFGLPLIPDFVGEGGCEGEKDGGSDEGEGNAAKKGGIISDFLGEGGALLSGMPMISDFLGKGGGKRDKNGRSTGGPDKD